MMPIAPLLCLSWNRVTILDFLSVGCCVIRVRAGISEFVRSNAANVTSRDGLRVGGPVTLSQELPHKSEPRNTLFELAFAALLHLSGIRACLRDPDVVFHLIRRAFVSSIWSQL